MMQQRNSRLFGSIRRGTTVAIAVSLLAAACSSGRHSTTGSTASPSTATAVNTQLPSVKIGMITALTGPIAPGDAAAVAAAQARVKLANAQGGAGGHQVDLVVADDTSTAQGALTAVQSLISKGVVGIIELDPVTYPGAAEQYTLAHHVPVAGVAIGPEVTDANFYSILGATGPTVPQSTSLGVFLKSLGVTKIAGVAWGSLAAAVALLQGPLKAAGTVGVQTVLTDLSPAPTTTDFTSDALKIKSSGAQSVYTAMGLASNLALASALNQQGVHLPGQVYGASVYEASVLSSPSESALEGAYIQYWFAPVELESSATKAYTSTLDKYAPGTFGGEYETIGYVGADLLIHGISSAQGTVSASSVGTAIGGTSDYTGAGLIPEPINYTISRTDPANVEKCFWYPQIKNKQFVITASHPICGDLVH